MAMRGDLLRFKKAQDKKEIHDNTKPGTVYIIPNVSHAI
jgi:hypothetical protein